MPPFDLYLGDCQCTGGVPENSTLPTNWASITEFYKAHTWIQQTKWGHGQISSDYSFGTTGDYLTARYQANGCGASGTVKFNRYGGGLTYNNVGTNLSSETCIGWFSPYSIISPTHSVRDCGGGTTHELFLENEMTEAMFQDDLTALLDYGRFGPNVWFPGGYPIRNSYSEFPSGRYDIQRDYTISEPTLVEAYRFDHRAYCDRSTAPGSKPYCPARDVGFGTQYFNSRRQVTMGKSLFKGWTSYALYHYSVPYGYQPILLFDTANANCGHNIDGLPCHGYYSTEAEENVFGYPPAFVNSETVSRGADEPLFVHPPDEPGFTIVIPGTTAVSRHPEKPRRCYFLNLSATRLSSSSIKLTWNAASGVGGYNVWRASLSPARPSQSSGVDKRWWRATKIATLTGSTPSEYTDTANPGYSTYYWISTWGTDPVTDEIRRTEPVTI